MRSSNPVLSGRGFARINGDAVGTRDLNTIEARPSSASMFIVMDLDQIEKAVAARVPEEESWRCAFGLMVTLVWLYLEVLRLISILRSND